MSKAPAARARVSKRSLSAVTADRETEHEWDATKLRASKVLGPGGALNWRFEAYDKQHPTQWFTVNCDDIEHVVETNAAGTHNAIEWCIEKWKKQDLARGRGDLRPPAVKVCLGTASVTKTASLTLAGLCPGWLEVNAGL